MTEMNQRVFRGHTTSNFCDTGPHLEVGLIPENSLVQFVLNRVADMGTSTAMRLPDSTRLCMCSRATAEVPRWDSGGRSVQSRVSLCTSAHRWENLAYALHCAWHRRHLTSLNN